MKTRDKLIEVARQLFARKGVENTTISDIAEASDKGRRTIYTYFKNKLDIYNAVLAEEANKMLSRIEDIVDNPHLSSSDKLRECIIEHFKLRVRKTESESLKGIMYLDLRRIEKLRRLASERESALLDRVLEEGVRRGEFRAASAEKVRGFLVQVMMSMAVSVEARSDDSELWGAVRSFAEYISDSIARN